MLSFENREGYIWLNGGLKPWNDCKIHIITHSLHYGSAVFEGIRAYNKKPFKLQEHNQRLLDSCKILGINVPFSLEQINKATYDVIEANNFVDCYIRPLVWYGSSVMGVSSLKSDVNVAVAAWEWPSYFSGAIRLNWSRWKRPSPDTAPVHAKASGLYMIATMTKNDAERDGYQDGLMLDYRGYVAECSGANIFFVFGNEIHTPISDCFLNGITRQTVIDIIKNKTSYLLVERHIKPEEIKQANEVFITGTAAEITPVIAIENLSYEFGMVTQNLQNLYKNQVNT